MPGHHRRQISTTRQPVRWFEISLMPGRSPRSSTSASLCTSPVGQRSNRCCNSPSSTKGGRLPAAPARPMSEQQTLAGCAFCEAAPGTETGTAYTWGKRSGSPTPSVWTARSKQSRIPTSAITMPTTAVGSSSMPSQRRRRVAPAASGTSGPARLTRFRVELGHLEGPLQLCARCSPDGPATYWTRDLDEHLVATSLE